MDGGVAYLLFLAGVELGFGLLTVCGSGTGVLTWVTTGGASGVAAEGSGAGVLSGSEEGAALVSGGGCWAGGSLTVSR